MELLTDPNVWASFVALSALEIVLGIDNVIFLSIITEKLPPDQAKRARQIGLALALVFRIVLLLSIFWIIGMTRPLFEVFGQDFSVRDLILIAGGLFLIVKATQEVHAEIEGEDEHEEKGKAPVAAAFSAVIAQIVVIDAIFSIDSIITAVGMAERVEVMIAAVILAIGVMYVAAETVAAFIERHPTTKMLALTFLMLVGMALVADGFGFHIPRSYIYSAMAFAAATEVFNIMAIRRRKLRRGGKRP
ncbi:MULTISPECIES: TerC family protein [Rhodomicrobium]|uniref:TerC family protein n=1 Tax=Rhodomicrobium TaxID=1068 RepID=UPI001FDA9418|nr:MULTISPECIES: TerC family protein [Rhodomicrobium]